MSETTKPYDPWEATDDDTRHAIGAYSEARSSGGDAVIGMLAAMRVYGDRVRARVEAYQAAGATPKPATRHDKPWVKIGDVVVPITRIAKLKRYAHGVFVRIDGESFDVRNSEADDLWAHVTHPVRCVDLTPAVATTTPNP